MSKLFRLCCIEFRNTFGIKMYSALELSMNTSMYLKEADGSHDIFVSG